MLNGICGVFNSFYFIGIGGVSMSALAKFLVDNGKTVAGSDVAESIYVHELIQKGVRISLGNSWESIAEFEVIVYTDAISENDNQLCEASALGKLIISRGQLLYEISRNFAHTIAISGCHGKTTCTSMLAHIFSAANVNFCAHIGGRDLGFSNYCNFGDDYFITEACEYKKNFLLLKPEIAVILNCRPDHLECYNGEEELYESYKNFADGANVSIYLYGDCVGGQLSFGFDKNADYSARNITENCGTYSFTAFEGDCELGRICLNVFGKHNILNALAAIAAARYAQISFASISKGLINFRGVERRFEKIGMVNGAVCIADYAHHPDEIRASLRTLKKVAQGKMYVIFQPHTYSRTKNLFKQFVRVLSPLNNLLVYRTYAAREYYDDKGSALTLSRKLKKSRYGDEPCDILQFVMNARDGDAVIFLGAGDIYDIAKAVINNIDACH